MYNRCTFDINRFSQTNNLERMVNKGKPLEFALRKTLKKVHVSFEDFTEIFNFLADRKCVPDFTTLSDLIEAKDWDCEHWKRKSIGIGIAKKEIDERSINFPDLHRILVITKPKWDPGVKEYLIQKGWTIIDLNFVVTWQNVKTAISKLRQLLRPLLRLSLYHKLTNRSCSYVRRSTVFSALFSLKRSLSLESTFIQQKSKFHRPKSAMFDVGSLEYNVALANNGASSIEFIASSASSSPCLTSLSAPTSSEKPPLFIRITLLMLASLSSPGDSISLFLKEFSDLYES
jgi:hypothetical protein